MLTTPICFISEMPIEIYLYTRTILNWICKLATNSIISW